jgi:hypothetical protein
MAIPESASATAADKLASATAGPDVHAAAATTATHIASAAGTHPATAPTAPTAGMHRAASASASAASTTATATATATVRREGCRRDEQACGDCRDKREFS